MNPDIYFNVLDEEVENKIFDKYEPHKTSYTTSGNDSGEPGRPTNDDPTNPSTIKPRLGIAMRSREPSTK